ncbi:MAG: hypothetical protein ABIH92_01955 [Nanoarchaeota archaeon]
MAKNLGNMWECECGNVDYGEYPPQECAECQAIDSFVRVPEDLVEERKEESVLSLKPEEEDESE